MMYDVVSVGRSNMDLYSQDIGAAFADITGVDATVGGSPTNLKCGGILEGTAFLKHHLDLPQGGT